MHIILFLLSSFLAHAGEANLNHLKQDSKLRLMADSAHAYSMKKDFNTDIFLLIDMKQLIQMYSQ